MLAQRSPLLTRVLVAAGLLAFGAWHLFGKFGAAPKPFSVIQLEDTENDVLVTARWAAKRNGLPSLTTRTTIAVPKTKPHITTTSTTSELTTSTELSNTTTGPFDITWASGSGATQDWRWLLVTEMGGAFGGLGDRVFDIVSALSVGNFLWRRVAFDMNKASSTVRLLETATALFPRLARDMSAWSFPEDEVTSIDFTTACCKSSNTTPLYEASNERVIRINNSFAQSHQLFHYMRDQVRWMLNATLDHLEEDIPKLMPMKKLLDRNVFRICVIVRRGDSITSERVTPSMLNFTAPAINAVVQYFHTAGLNRLGVIMMGIDKNFIADVVHELRQWPQFNDTIGDRLSGTVESDPELTWLFSARFCDSAIITASGSSFSFWTAYLHSERLPLPDHLKRVFYNELYDYPDPNYMDQYSLVDLFPPEWQRLRLENVTQDSDPRVSMVKS